jgi:hypothetical protein
VVGSEEATIRESRHTSRVVSLAETGIPLGRSEDIRFAQNGLQLTLRLFNWKFENWGLRIGAKKVCPAIVHHDDHELYLSLAFAFGKEIPHRLPRRIGCRVGHRDLESTEAERIRTKEDLLCRDGGRSVRI